MPNTDSVTGYCSLKIQDFSEGACIYFTYIHSVLVFVLFFFLQRNTLSYPFFQKFPFPGKVFLTSVCEAVSKQGGWVAQLQGAAFTVSSI